MAVVSALVFVSALALVVAVIARTLVPECQRILVALAGQPQLQPRPVVVRRHRIVRQDRRVAHLAARLREAA